jgi:hypothetical protein
MADKKLKQVFLILLVLTVGATVTVFIRNRKSKTDGDDPPLIVKTNDGKASNNPTDSGVKDGENKDGDENKGDDKKPPDPPTRRPELNLKVKVAGDVQRYLAQVFTSRWSELPFANRWFDLAVGDRVWTRQDGEAILRFKERKCATVHLYRNTDYIKSPCSREETEESGNVNCLPNGTVSVEEERCLDGSGIGFNTETAEIRPNATNYVVRYNKDTKLTMVAVLEGNVFVRPVVKLQPRALGEQIRIDEGDCMISKPGATIDSKEDGVPAMQPVRGSLCRRFLERDGNMAALDRQARSDGTVVRPEPAFPQSFDFAPRALGFTETKEFIYQNDGLLTANIRNLLIDKEGIEDFRVWAVDNCDKKPIAGDVRCLIKVEFKPVVGGERRGTLSIEDNTEDSPHRIPLKGMGVIDPSLSSSLSYSPQFVTFAPQPVKSTSKEEKEVIFDNNGATPVKFSEPKFFGDAVGDFAVVSNTCKDSVDKRCIIKLSFTPQLLAERKATLSVEAERVVPQGFIVSGKPERITYTIPLSGAGTPPGVPPVLSISQPAISVSAPSLMCFGLHKQVKAGGDEDRGMQTIEVTNVGNVPLNIGANVYNVNDFQLTDNCKGKKVGEKCTISVKFTPRRKGEIKAILTIDQEGAAGRPVEVPLAGAGKSKHLIVRAFNKVFGRNKQPCAVQPGSIVKRSQP